MDSARERSTGYASAGQSPSGSLPLHSDRHKCEIWEIYTKQRILKRCSTGEVKNAQECAIIYATKHSGITLTSDRIKEHMKHMPSYYAWISDDHSHFYLKDVLSAS